MCAIMPSPKISYHQALRLFKKPVAMARAFNVTRASVSDWKNKGWIPEGRVWQLIALYPDKFPVNKTAAAKKAASIRR